MTRRKIAAQTMTTSATAETQRKTVPPQLKPWRPGQSGNPAGRPKGSRTKLAEDFVADALAEWKESGPAALKHMASEDPSKFCQMVANLMPKQLDVKTTVVEEMGEDELAASIASLRSLLAVASAGTGSAPKTQH